MRIILKPLGAAFLVGAISALGILAFRNNRTAAPLPATGLSKAAAIPINNTVTAPPRGDTLVVYDDAMQNGWEPRGWAKGLDIACATTVYNKTGKSIRVVAGPYEAVKLYHPGMDTSSYRYLSFRVHGGSESGKTLWMQEVAGGKNQKQLYLKPLPADRWVKVVVPLAMTGVEGRKDFNAFWVQNGSGDDKVEYFVDDVRLSVSEPPAEEGQMTPETSAPTLESQ